MDITPLISKDLNIIQSYKSGQFEVSSKQFTTPIIVLPKHILEWDVSDVYNITEADFDQILDNRQDIDILLFGGGNKQQFPEPELRNILQQNRIAIEAMDTGAACRTYNLLLAEGRKIAAALIPFT